MKVSSFACLLAPLTIAASIGLSAVTAANAATVNGTWLRPSTGGQIQVFDCGGGIGMKVTKSSDANKVGKQIMCGATKTGENRYEGDLLNLDDGNTYKGIIEFKGDTLSLSGCVLGGLVCKTDNWTRVK